MMLAAAKISCIEGIIGATPSIDDTDLEIGPYLKIIECIQITGRKLLGTQVFTLVQAEFESNCHKIGRFLPSLYFE